MYAYDAYNCRVSPEFDPAKNSANLAKHGVSLADAEGVLCDPLAITLEDIRARGEARWVTLGVNAMGRLLVVVWAERTDDVRLISARCATARERRDYEKRV